MLLWPIQSSCLGHCCSGKLFTKLLLPFNLLLFRHQSPIRKVPEALWAELFAAIVPPRRQLELYLNSAEFGPWLASKWSSRWTPTKRAPIAGL